jgi:hypothetical protein
MMHLEETRYELDREPVVGSCEHCLSNYQLPGGGYINDKTKKKKDLPSGYGSSLWMISMKKLVTLYKLAIPRALNCGEA